MVSGGQEPALMSESGLQGMTPRGIPKHGIDYHINGKIQIKQCDITTLAVDAIVNPANSGLQGGGGVDGVIHRVAGPELKEECAMLNGCRVGMAKITRSYRLPAKTIIHTVGPKDENPEMLARCYENSLNLLRRNKLRTIAFPCIATGGYGYPKEEAAHVALGSVRKWLEKNCDYVDKIIFCVFTEQDRSVYHNLAHIYFPVRMVETTAQMGNNSGLSAQALPPSSKRRGCSPESKPSTSSMEKGYPGCNQAMSPGVTARELKIAFNSNTIQTLPSGLNPDHMKIDMGEDEISAQRVQFNEEVGLSMLVQAELNGTKVNMVVDTAAQITMFSDKVWQDVGLDHLDYENIQIKNAQQGAFMECRVYRKVKLKIQNQEYELDVAVGPISDGALMGLDFMFKYKVTPVPAESEIWIGKQVVPAIMKKTISGEKYNVSKLQIARTITIPPTESRLVRISMTNPVQRDFLVTPNGAENWHVGSGLVKGGQGDVCVEISNDSIHEVTFKKGQLITDAVEVEAVKTFEQEPELGPLPAQMEQDEPEVRSCSMQAEDDSEVPEDPPLISPTLIPDRNTDPDYLSAKYSEVRNRIPEHIKKMYDEGCVHLEVHECIALGLLLIKYSHVFSKDSKDLGHFRRLKHLINTFNEAPVREKLRRTPMKFEQEEEKIINDMLEAGVIQPSISEWASAPVLVRKKSGELRYTVDYRKLNIKTIRDQYPLPLIDACLDTLAGNMYFHTMDLCSGYWQIEIDEKDRHKTAFLTKFGLYEHVRLAQGLCNSPATFQRVMNFIFKGLVWREMVIYLDDALMGGINFLCSLTSLEKALFRAHIHGIKYKPAKCHLFRIEVEALGRLINRNGVAMTDEHIKCIKEWPTPKNGPDVMKFTGFINYHRDFIQGLAEIIQPLYELTQKKKDFVWTDECESAFQKLKQMMCRPPVLAFPTREGRFVLDTDASDGAIGAGLYQYQENQLKAISFASASLTPEQKRYCTTRKELLSVVYFTRHFRHYLLSQEFDLRTDHASLIWLCSFKDPQGQLGRWLEELAQYAMVITHRAGKKHDNADSLSRIQPEEPECVYYRSGADLNSLPCQGCSYCIRLHKQWRRFEEEVDYVIPLANLDRRVIQNEVITVKQVEVREEEDDENEENQQGDQDSEFNFMEYHTPEQMREAQLKDFDVRPVLVWMEDEHVPTLEELEQESIETRTLWRAREHLTIVNGVLYYEWHNNIGSKNKLLVPHELKEEVLKAVHDRITGGHWGRDKTTERLKMSFFWPTMGRDCRLFIDTCALCHRNKNSRNLRAELKNYQAGSPGERVHLDFLGPFTESSSGNRYILSMIDQFCKWIELKALPEQSAVLTAQTFFQQWIARFGVPLKVHTDQGRNFESRLFADLCQYFETVKTRTTRHRPSSNGQVERYNQMILSYIRCYLKDKPEEWDKHLDALGMSLRATVNRSTGFTANMLRLGQEVNLPEDVFFGVAQANTKEAEVPEYLRGLQDTLRCAFQTARENMQTAQRRQKVDYDTRSPLRQTKFEVGDLVYMKNCNHVVGISRKLQPIMMGPYIVTKVISSILYKICDRRKEIVCHHDKMRICNDREIPLWIQRKRQEILFQDEPATGSAAAGELGQVDTEPIPSTSGVVAGSKSSEGNGNGMELRPDIGTNAKQRSEQVNIVNETSSTSGFAAGGEKSDSHHLAEPNPNCNFDETMPYAFPFSGEPEVETEEMVITPLKLARRGRRRWQIMK